MLQEQKMEDFYPKLQVATEENCKESGKVVTMGMPMSVLKEDNIFEKIIAIKYDVPNDKLEMFDDYKKAVDTFYDKVLEKNG